MQKTFAKSFLILLAVMVGADCRKSRGAGVGGDEYLGFFQKGMPVNSASVTNEVPSPLAKKAAGTSPLALMDASRKLIRNAEVSIEVRDFEAAARKAGEIARSLGGYVADSQASGEGSRKRGRLTIRVRASDFDQALASLRALGDVQSEHVSTQDITKEYADLETRLRVKRDAAERVRAILHTKTARLSDVLEAEKQLTELIEEIEVIGGAAFL
jgi:hypothetical protein